MDRRGKYINDPQKGIWRNGFVGSGFSTEVCSSSEGADPDPFLRGGVVTAKLLLTAHPHGVPSDACPLITASSLLSRFYHFRLNILKTLSLLLAQQLRLASQLPCHCLSLPSFSSPQKKKSQISLTLRHLLSLILSRSEMCRVTLNETVMYSFSSCNYS